MRTSIDINKEEIASLLKKMSPKEMRTALEDSGTFIIESTHVGYLDEKSPDGDKWEENPQWYKQAKGEAAILTGPTSHKIHGGPFADKYKFANIHKRRMRNSLMVRVEGETRAVVEYMTSVKKRADITQYGGESKMILKSTVGKSDLVIDLNVIPRPHLGVADSYARVGGKTDPEHIIDIFSLMVDKHIG